MMNWRRFLLYLVLNAIVSGIVTVSVVAIWDATHRGPVGVATPTPPHPSAAAGRHANRLSNSSHRHSNRLRSAIRRHLGQYRAGVRRLGGRHYGGEWVKRFQSV